MRWTPRELVRLVVADAPPRVAPAGVEKPAGRARDVLLQETRVEKRIRQSHRVPLTAAQAAAAAAAAAGEQPRK